MARGGIFRPEILEFCRSRTAGSSGVVHVLKLRAYLRRFEGLGRWSLRDCGFTWGHVKLFLVLKFLGLVDRRP